MLSTSYPEAVDVASRLDPTEPSMVFQKNFTFSHGAILDAHVSSKGPSKCRSDILLSQPVPVLIAHGVIYLDGYVRDLLGILGPLRDRIRVRRAAKIRRGGGAGRGTR